MIVCKCLHPTKSGKCCILCFYKRKNLKQYIVYSILTIMQLFNTNTYLFNFFKREL